MKIFIRNPKLGFLAFFEEKTMQREMTKEMKKRKKKAIRRLAPCFRSEHGLQMDLSFCLPKDLRQIEQRIDEEP